MRRILFLLLLTTLTLAQTQPAPPKLKITIAKDTTYLTDIAPRPDGTINYLPSHDASIGNGVTLDNNLLIPMLRICGPERVSEKIRPAFLRRLRLQDLPLEGDYFQTFDEYLRSTAVPPEAFWRLQDDYNLVAVRPWAAKDHPELAAWLEKNARHLDAAAKASNRDRFYIPAIGDEDDWLVSVLLPGLANFRALANGVTLRASLRAAEGNLDAAWQDSLAAHRLARACSTGGTVIERLVAWACELQAIRSDSAILSTGKLTAAQAKACLADLQKLPPLGDLLVPFQGERLAALDTVMLVARGKGAKLKTLSPDIAPPDRPFPLDLTAAQRDQVDWDTILRHFNNYYDKQIANIQRATYAQRVGGIYQLEKETEDARKADLAAAKEREPDLTSQVEMLLDAVFLPSFTKAAILHERSLLFADLNQLAFALTAYKADHGQYPDKLADLSPAYLKSIPLDRFNDQPLHYKPSHDGILLYSVGEDFKDDGGQDPSLTTKLPHDLVYRIGE